MIQTPETDNNFTTLKSSIYLNIYLSTYLYAHPEIDIGRVGVEVSLVVFTAGTKAETAQSVQESRLELLKEQGERKQGRRCGPRRCRRDGTILKGS